MALHAYLQESVDSTVVECGIGGEYDSTNIFVHPTVTAVTNLGIDHVAMLGSTLSEIAWHKAGIFKPHSVAFTVPQPAEALTVLRERAAEKGITLHVVERHPDLENDSIKLGLSADFQKTNASLAVAAAHLRAFGHTSIPDPTVTPHIRLPAEFKRGLEQVQWPGRCEVRRDAQSGIAWHIDGGHTLDSIEVSGRWFAEQISASSPNGSHQAQKPRILIFNQQTRDANALARVLYTTLQSGLSTSTSPFTHVFFTTNQTFSTGYKPDLISLNTNKSDIDTLAVQRALASTWEEIDHSASVSVVRTIKGAIGKAREIAAAWEGDDDIMVLITGSLHLVGGAIEVLESEK